MAERDTMGSAGAAALAERAAAALIHCSARFSARLLRRDRDRIAAVALVAPHEFRFLSEGMSFSALAWPGPGDRLPLVVLHGLNGTAWSWARIASLLCRGRPVVAPCLRGHGESPIPPSGCGLEQTGADLEALLDQLGCGRVHLAGESWGGKVALHFAAARPERIASLLLADPVMPWGLDPLVSRAPLLLRAAFRQERVVYHDEEALERHARRVVYLPAGDSLDRRAWHGRFAPGPDGRCLPRLPAAAFEQIVREVLPRDISRQVAGMAVPTLLLRPTLGISIVPGAAARLGRLIPGLIERRLAGDHTFVAGYPTTAAREMELFLNGRQ